MHTPSEKHMKAMYQNLTYLKNAPGKCLLFSKSDTLGIVGYTDPNWVRDQTNRRSHPDTLCLSKEI